LSTAQETWKKAEKQTIIQPTTDTFVLDWAEMIKKNLISLLISAGIFMAAWWYRQEWPLAASAHGRYYVSAVLMISAVVALITACRLVGMQRRRSATTTRVQAPAQERPRQHYRLQFDQTSRPQFVQKVDDPDSAAGFSCPVRDISETGISLDCTGVYAVDQTIQGQIIFQSGRTAPINGTVVRIDPQRTCLHLHCTIDPPLLMAEQREQISHNKANGPRPVVSESILDTGTGSLPSHSPKGICRLKRR
jgi:hypothetical protein